MNNKPKLIIISGRPGSGKTTLSKELGLLIKFPVFCRDEFKEGYVNTFGIKHSELPENTNKIVTDTFFNTIESVLVRNISLIAEAAFQHQVWEKFIERIEDKCDISIIVCNIDDNLAAERHLQRGLKDSEREYFHGDPRVTHYKKTGEMLGSAEYSPPNFSYKTISVSTEDGYSPSLNSIKETLFKKI
jgi:adenylate kinase family enzyme